MRYEAPSSLDQAVALLAERVARRACWPAAPICWCRCETDVIEPGSAGRHQGHRRDCARSRRRPAAFASAPPSPARSSRSTPTLKPAWPGVVEAANLIGSTQVQGRATMGGNLCNGSPAADSVPALIAAGAMATIVGPKGRRDAAGRGRDARPRASCRWPRARSSPRSCCRPAPPRIGRRLPALHPAHRDGHRGGRLRRVA